MTLRTRLLSPFVLVLLLVLSCWYGSTRKSAEDPAAPSYIHPHRDERTMDAKGKNDAAISSTAPSSDPHQPSPVDVPPNDNSSSELVSTRAAAVPDKSVVSILEGADLSDPKVRARVVAEMAALCATHTRNSKAATRNETPALPMMITAQVSGAHRPLSSLHYQHENDEAGDQEQGHGQDLQDQEHHQIKDPIDPCAWQFVALHGGQ